MSVKSFINKISKIDKNEADIRYQVINDILELKTEATIADFDKSKVDLKQSNVYVYINSLGTGRPKTDPRNSGIKKLMKILVEYNALIIGFQQRLLSEPVQVINKPAELSLDSIQKKHPNINKDNALHLFLKVPIPPKTLLVFGAPGTGKSHFIENKIKEEFGIDIQKKYRTVFHQEYTYANFFGQFRPQTIHRSSATLSQTGGKLKKDRVWKEMGSISSLQDDVRVVYSFSPGPFMKALAYAWKHPTEHVALIIEELNRGNAAAIFGELFQLLDRPKSNNYSSQYPIEIDPAALDWFKSQLSAEITDKEEIQTISLPPNLHLFATMNQASQGVFPLDTAFKRRWSFQYMPLDGDGNGPDGTCKINEKEYSWQYIRKAINDELTNSDQNIPQDRLLGAYFLSQEELEQPIKAIQDKVIPYLWNDVVPRNRKSLFKEELKTIETVRENLGFNEPILEKTKETSAS